MLMNFLKYVMLIILVEVDKINIYDIDDISEINQARRRFDSGRLHQEPMSSILDRLSILERLPSSRRMREHDEAGKSSKKYPKKHHYDEHFNKDWDKDLWD